MNQYLLYQRYVSSFGGSRLDQIVEIRRKESRELLDQYSIMGGPSDDVLKRLVERVSEKYPIHEGDSVETIARTQADPLPGFEGMGLVTAPLEQRYVTDFQSYLARHGLKPE